MADFNFITIRLGKDSIPDIQKICSSIVGVLDNPFIINVICTQIPDSYNEGDYAFIWLGSDNNKGTPTKWKQGFKAVGRVKRVVRGQNYNDTSETEVEIVYIFHNSVNRMDILRCAPDAYYWCSSMPLIGLDDHANQTIRNMSGNMFSDLRAFFYSIESVTNRFKKDIIQVEPQFRQFFNISIPDPQKYPFAKNLDEIPLIIENEPKILQQIFYGAPGTGKSFAIEEQTKDEDVIRTTFHPDSDYSTFVGCYKPTTIDVPMRDVTGKVIVEKGEPVTEKRIVYEFVNQAFLQAYVGAWKKMAGVTIDKAQKQYLVIEEINRGNCAQIFGDLFQLLDRNRWGFSEYPIKADADMKKQIKKQLAGLTFINDLFISALFGGKDIVGQVLEGDILLLPPNLYIWATMNTSDQSLFPIDSAFKRRWDWQYVPIANAGKNWIIEVNSKRYDWWDFLVKINELVGSTTHSEDKKLGYFFCKTNDGVISAETFVSKVIFYLWNDVFKDFEFDDEKFNDTEKDSIGNVTKLTFDKFYGIDLNGKPVVKEDKVDIFMTNLGVKFAQDAVDENDIYSDSEDSNATRFSLDGIPMSLRDIAMNVVQNYANNNSSLNAEAIRNYFIALCKGIGVAHIVETETEYHRRDGQPSQERSVSEITIPNGEKLYVTSQWRANNENSNFMRFMKIVNENGLGVISQ